MIKKEILNNKIVIPISSTEEEEDSSLFISPGEYPVYDDNNYDFMQDDKHLRKCYINAIKNNVEGKNVLDIGTGRDMDWAMYSLDYDAKSSTGVEVMESTYNLSKEILKDHIYEDKMTLINKLSTDFIPKEKFDVCISEIIGTIGGSEGVAVVLTDAKKRLLIPNGKMIPYSCITKAGVVCIRDIVNPLQFHPDSIKYIENVFKEIGSYFDIRLTLTYPEPKNIISAHGAIETLNFEEGDLIVERIETCELIIKKSGLMDGLLLWIELLAEKNGKEVNSLYQKSAWETVYIPIFDTPIQVNKGDKINVSCERVLSDDNIHPNYYFKCNINGDKDKSGEFNSYHHHDKDIFQKEIYKELFKIKE